MEAVAALAGRMSFGLIRVTHSQNLLLGDVRQSDLYALWQELRGLGLAMPNIGTLTDMIACPGLDFCSLANAGTLNVAKQIQEQFDDLDYLYDLGDIEIKMSGCMNACGHHHVGHIGILGVDKHGEEWYQITLGGSVNGFTALGEVIGPSVPQAEVVASTIRAHRRGSIARSAKTANASSKHSAALCETFQGARLCDTFSSGVKSVEDDWRYAGEDGADEAGSPALIVPFADFRTHTAKWRAY